jgi:hypothetical protein
LANAERRSNSVFSLPLTLKRVRNMLASN